MLRTPLRELAPALPVETILEVADHPDPELSDFGFNLLE